LRRSATGGRLEAATVTSRFGLSYRDLEELLAERGVEVDHVTCSNSLRPASRRTDDASI
jgi:transposase-like protein